jgi:16S rRNA (guanine966-N2)-methyltransferase
VRIIAGRNRGRRLEAPPGEITRPTAERMRQALFDMLWHAPWAGREAIEEQAVLDAFAGTGALGLEALSRGAANACFLENDKPALAALRANIAACKEQDSSRVLAVDATKPSRSATACSLVFLDPPYGKDLVPRALVSLSGAGWIAPGALVCAEMGRDETAELTGFEILADRSHGAARILVLRAPE